MPHIAVTGEVTLGNLLIVVSLIGIAISFGVRLGSFQASLESHSKTIEDHGKKLSKHDDIFLSLVQDVQRLIGRNEAHARGRG